MALLAILTIFFGKSCCFHEKAAKLFHISAMLFQWEAAKAPSQVRRGFPEFVHFRFEVEQSDALIYAMILHFCSSIDNYLLVTRLEVPGDRCCLLNVHLSDLCEKFYPQRMGLPTVPSQNIVCPEKPTALLFIFRHRQNTKGNPEYPFSFSTLLCLQRLSLWRAFGRAGVWRTACIGV